eukprot:12398940-Heterocapsa_arctica.AAC.1
MCLARLGSAQRSQGRALPSMRRPLSVPPEPMTATIDMGPPSGGMYVCMCVCCLLYTSPSPRDA